MADDDRDPRPIPSNVRLTRDEIVNQAFAPAFRGLSEAAVRAFLRRVADDYDAVRTRQDELFGEIERLETQLAQVPPAPPEQDLLAAVGDETARVLRSAQESAEEIRRGAEERAADLLREAHDEALLLREQTEQAATERTRHADDTAAEVLREAERLALELQEGAEARVAEFEAQAEAEARAELESARRRSRELVAEAEAMRDRMLSELARRRDALESQLELLRGGRDRLLDAYKVVKATLDQTTEALRTVDARPAADPGRARVTSAALPPSHAAPDAPAGSTAAGNEAPAGAPGTGGSAGSGGAPPDSFEPVASVDAGESRREVASSPDRSSEPDAGTTAQPRVGSFTLGELEGPVGEREGARPRRERSTRPAPPLEKFTVEQPSGVRLLGSSPEPAPAVAHPREAEEQEAPPAEPSPEPAAEPAPGPAAASGATSGATSVATSVATGPSEGASVPHDTGAAPPTGAGPADTGPLAENRAETVDEIFARIRAEQSLASAGARAGTEEPPEAIAPEPLAEAPAGPGGEDTQEAEPESHPEPVAAPDAEANTDTELDDVDTDADDGPSEDPIIPRTGLPGPEVALTRRRDEALDPLVEEVVRAVKRMVRDEQNVVLQAVREHRGVPTADAILPSSEEQDQAFADATAELLNEASVLGEAVARELGVAGGINGDGAKRRTRARGMAASLARELMDPLRGKLTDALRDGSGGGDETQIAERIRGRYREWKGPRIDTACRNALAGAFARGLYDAVPEGMPLRWLTTDPSPCPDCADNVLEQTPRGRKFPTGHTMPPAHPGCHCLVLPAEVAADL